MVSLNGRRRPITVAVDAMGGDHAPEEILLGLLEAQRQGVNVIAVGHGAQLEACLEKLRGSVPVVHAPEVIAMNERVSSSLGTRPTSLKVATQLVTDGKADAVVSCGNSTAIYFVAFHLWGTQPGIDRPAFGGTVMTGGGPIFLLDIGANATVKVSNLVQFAVMGDVYMKLACDCASPRVALLSNGSEDSKGTKEVKEANQVLRKLPLNFVGNVEANEIFDGRVDVVVCDGFSGNVLLKCGEGVATEIFKLLRKELSKDLVSKLAAAALKPAFSRIKRHLDYEEYGGAPVLGVNGIMINCHGRSHAKAVTNAIKLAQRMAGERLVDRIGEALHADEVEASGRTRRLARALHLRHTDV